MNDRQQRNLGLAAAAGLLAGIVAVADLAAADPVAATDWPQIGGPCGGFAVNDPSLRDDWTGTEGKVAWRAKLTGPVTGRGVSIADGLVFAVDNDPAGTQAILRVLGLDDGQERWHCRWPTGGEVHVQNNSGGVHGSVPAVAADAVYVIGECRWDRETAVLRAIDRTSHGIIWAMDPAKNGWALHQTSIPIVVNGFVVVQCGASGSRDILLALDRRTGEVAWQSEQQMKGFRGRMMIAPQVATLGGIRQIVMHYQGGVAGVGLDGKRLWTWEGYRRGTLRTTPSVSPEGLIFVASGHEGSSAMFRVSRAGDDWTCTTIYADGLTGRGQSVKDKDNNPFWPTVPHLVDGNDFYNSGAWWDEALYVNAAKGLHCTLADGTIAWHSAKGGRGAGVIAVNGRILTLEGVKGKGVCLAIYRADPKTRTQLATIPIHQRSHNVELAYADGRVIAVSPLDGEVVCVDLGAKRP
jgi:hypothetical protein